MLNHLYKKIDSFDFSKDSFSCKNFRLHYHNFSEIIYVKSGVLNLIVNNVFYSIPAEKSCFILPNTPHTILENNCSFDIIVFSNSFIQNIVEKYNDIYTENIIMNLEKNYINSISNKNDIYYITSIFNYIFHLFIHNNAFKKANLQYRNFVQKTLVYIEENYNKSANVNDCAKFINLNSHYTSNVFSKYFHCTFPQILNIIRVEKASRLLTESNININEISNQCGYDNMRTFNRNFIQIMNITPREYRKNPIKNR